MRSGSRSSSGAKHVIHERRPYLGPTAADVKAVFSARDPQSSPRRALV